MADAKLSDEMRREIRCVRDPAQLSAWADRVEKLEQELRDAKEQLSWMLADDAKTREILGIASEDDGSVWHVAKRVAQLQQERDELRSRCAVQRKEMDSYVGRRTRQQEEIARLHSEHDAARDLLRRMLAAAENNDFSWDPASVSPLFVEARRLLDG